MRQARRSRATTRCCSCRRRHRPAQPAPRTGARRRPLPAAPSPAGLERKRRPVDRLGAQARQAARAEPACCAARRDTTFLSIDGRPPTVPEGVRYVITLDADTRLPRDTVRRLIGKMAHPLNRPRFDPVPATRRRGLCDPAAARHAVPAGRRRRLAYPARILQPERHRSLCRGGLRRLSGPVRRRLLCRQGHLRRRRLRGRARRPRARTRRLLSHDLFEGVFARAGLASDVEVVEDSFRPATTSPSLRHHRWARGDWQLLPWILGWSALLGKSRRVPATMPAIGRWKMLDNLRRSVAPRTCVLALLAGWALAVRRGAGLDALHPRDDRAAEPVAGRWRRPGRAIPASARAATSPRSWPILAARSCRSC